MRLSDFFYELPDRLIAQHPPVNRGDSRLMVINGAAAKVDHLHFRNLIDLLNPGDLLIFNNTRVIPARLYGKKASGGKVEMMLERILDERKVLARIRASKSPGAGTSILFEGELRAQVQERNGEFFILEFETDSVINALENYAHMPLPPYIQREDTELDQSRYQTVFAKFAGAVAAPTAGLHFTDEFFLQLKHRNIECDFITLHIGAGTYQPVRSENLDDHTMHAEYLEVNQGIVDRVMHAKRRGGRVIAVGTTVVRSLESAAQSGELAAYQGDSQLFIKPGYDFKVIDAMVTNFHLPQSTLLMLVCAFAGYEITLKAYNEAVDQAYRFFSYGDAMFVLPDRSCWGQCEI